MYALKARDKLHKREKDAKKERKEERERRGRDDAAYHTGGGGGEGDRRQPATVSRGAQYLGSFSLELAGSKSSDLSKPVKHQLSRINTKNPISSVPVSLLISVEGVKVISSDGQDLIMAHALKRVLFCTPEAKKCLFALVSRNPEASGTDGIFCHVFLTPSKEKASELSDLVGKAFKAAFTKQTLKRMKKDKKRLSSSNVSSSSSQPWTVTQQPSPRQPISSQPWTVSQQPHQPQPSPSSHPSHPSHPSQPEASLSPSAPPLNVVHPGGQSLNAPNRPPLPQATPPQPPQQPPLLDETTRLHSEIATLNARISEIESRFSVVSGDERAVMDLTVQLSVYHDQLDDRRRALSSLQLVQHEAPSAPVGPSAPSPASSRHSDPALPDIANISLEDAVWFQEGLPREIAMEILAYQPEGAFIVRSSTSSPGSFALSLKAPPGGRIVHYLIEQGPAGLRLQGSQYVFPSLVELIQHYCLNQETLPCTLNMSSSNPTFLEGDSPDGTTAGGAGPRGGRGSSDSDPEDEAYLGGSGRFHLLH